jgi:hypothetical protein
VATKIGLFNAALADHLGHATLADTGEAVESGRLLNRVYPQVVAECIAAGSWNFAMETIQADADTGVTPAFGYAKVFAKPSDWVRTIGVSQDEYLNYPLTQYYDDDSFWSADSSPIYVRYVSDDTGLGLDLNRWPANFTRFVELSLAERVCLRITQSESRLKDVKDELKKARRTALAQDAQNEPQPKYPPPGGWTTSRGGRAGRGDRGSRGSLTG